MYLRYFGQFYSYCRFLDSVDDEVEWVMRAHHLTLAYKELGLILGKGSMTDVHDAIFSDFCIGK